MQYVKAPTGVTFTCDDRSCDSFQFQPRSQFRSLLKPQFEPKFESRFESKFQKWAWQPKALFAALLVWFALFAGLIGFVGLVGLVGLGSGALLTPTPAFADEFVGENTWQVVFTGTEMVENFNEEEYVDQIGHLQPGDSVKFQVMLENQADYDTNWYMTNKVVETLEEDVHNRTSAKDGFYSYRLTYVDPAGEETVLYNSDAIGSESQYLDEEGLHQATNALEDYFFLDELKPTQVANVYLDIHMDGETEGNEYQDTLAKLKMNFAVERAQNSTTPGAPGTPETPGQTGSTIMKSPTENENPLYPSVVQLVQTGDFWLAIAVFLVALSVGLIVLIVAIRRMSRERGEDR